MSGFVSIETRRDSHDRITVEVRGTNDIERAKRAASREIAGSFPTENYDVIVVPSVVFVEKEGTR